MTGTAKRPRHLYGGPGGEAGQPDDGVRQVGRFLAVADQVDQSGQQLFGAVVGFLSSEACHCSGLTSGLEWKDRAAGLEGQEIQIGLQRMFAPRVELDQDLWRKRHKSNRV